MKHVSILVPKGAVALSCIEGSFILFNQANNFLAAKGKPTAFKVELVGMDQDIQTYDRLFKVQPERSIDEVNKTDLIIIPAVNGNMDQVIENNKAFFPWIVEQHQNGAEVASLCVGAFLLAATGLADGKTCSTHWSSATDFRERFPNIELIDGKIITDEQGIYSSGGASSFWNLLLHILEKYTSREIAILAAKYFALEIDRSNQSVFTIFTGHRKHEDEPIRKAQDYIEANFEEKISVDKLADMLAIGRRSLERRFKKATATTVMEYIQRVKIEVAKKSFETSRKNVNEVMFDVGYHDTKASRTVFKNTTGLSPVEYRNKYNKEMMVA